jgi:DNA polymerase III gamma/tau subunit
MKTAAAVLFLLLSSAEAFSTSPLNVRSPVAQSNTQLFGYLGQLEQLSSDAGDNGVKKNGLNGTPMNGATQVTNGSTQVSNGAKVATMSNGATSNGSSHLSARSSAELLQMQVALAEAEARLAALKSELPSYKDSPKRVSINLKMPSIAIPQSLKTESAKKVVFAAAVAKEQPTVAAAPPVVGTPSKSVVVTAAVIEQVKAAKAAAKPVFKAVKPFAKAAAKPVVRAVKKAATKVASKPNGGGDYLSSLSSTNSFKLKSTPKATGGYLDSITKESLEARMKKILGHQTTAKLDPPTLLAYQFLRNVGGCVSISIGWFITSQKVTTTCVFSLFLCMFMKPHTDILC